MTDTQRKSLAVVVALAALVTVGSQLLLARPSPSPTPFPASLPAASSAASPLATLAAATSQPKITWSITSINVILSTGESTSSDLTFTSSQKLTNVTLSVVPQIAPFVTLQPGSILSLEANQAQSVHITFAIPSGTALGTYSGTIHVLSGSQTLPQTLKVTVNVWQPLTRPDIGFSIKYPPGWTAVENGQLVTFTNVPVAAPISTTSLQTQSFFEVRFLPQANPGALPVLQWLDQYFSQGFAVAPLSKTLVTVSGRQAVQLQTSEIGRRVHIYIPLDGDVVEITYGLFAPAFLSDYEAMLQSLEVN